MDFTSVNNTIIVIVTVFLDGLIVFWVDFIFKGDSSVIVGIIVVHDINGDVVNIITIPSTIAFNNGKWTITMDMTIVWAIFISPLVFNHDNALVNFTRIKRSIIVEITVRVDFSQVFWINVIFKIDRTIIVSVIVVNDFNGNLSNIITGPSTFTSVFFDNEWTITI